MDQGAEIPKVIRGFGGRSSSCASAVIDARNRAGLTQQALARQNGNDASPVVARLESGTKFAAVHEHACSVWRKPRELRAVLIRF